MERMREFITDAVVLHKEPLRDADARYFFFTKRHGKVAGKATSTRKITSKLADHLEPGTLTAVRFIERNGGGTGTQVIDALKNRSLHNSINRKSTRLNSNHQIISYTLFCFEKKKMTREKL